MEQLFHFIDNLFNPMRERDRLKVHAIVIGQAFVQIENVRNQVSGEFDSAMRYQMQSQVTNILERLPPSIGSLSAYGITVNRQDTWNPPPTSGNEIGWTLKDVIHYQHSLVDSLGLKQEYKIVVE